jgi:adenylate cyclase
MADDDADLHHRARETGAQAVGEARQALAARAARLIRSDPAAADLAQEMGLVDARWLEAPRNRRPAIAPPAEILERFLERAVEQRPSLLARLGLGAVQLLSSLTAPTSGAPRRLTVLFTDLEGFTAYTDEHGDADALALLESNHRVARPVVRRRGGRIVKRLGDGLLCTFAEPDSAVLAALELLDVAPPPLRLRAGMHVGEAVSTGTDVIGHVVNVAARITETASGGQALASATVVEAAGDLPGVRVGRSRSRRLKGVTGRVTVVELSPDGGRPT